MLLSVPSGDLPLAGTLCRVPHPNVQRRCRKRSRSSIDRLWKALTGAGWESLGNARFWEACCDMETGHGHRSALIAAGPLRRVLALARFLVWCRADFHGGRLRSSQVSLVLPILAKISSRLAVALRTRCAIVFASPHADGAVSAGRRGALTLISPHTRATAGYGRGTATKRVDPPGTRSRARAPLHRLSDVTRGSLPADPVERRERMKQIVSQIISRIVSYLWTLEQFTAKL